MMRGGWTVLKLGGIAAAILAATAVAAQLVSGAL